jgi:hypothetical protein
VEPLSDGRRVRGMLRLAGADVARALDARSGRAEGRAMLPHVAKVHQGVARAGDGEYIYVCSECFDGGLVGGLWPSGTSGLVLGQHRLIAGATDADCASESDFPLYSDSLRLTRQENELRLMREENARACSENGHRLA